MNLAYNNQYIDQDVDSQPTFDRLKKDKSSSKRQMQHQRRTGPASVNGIHRRRHKRVQW